MKACSASPALLTIAVSVPKDNDNDNDKDKDKYRSKDKDHFEKTLGAELNEKNMQYLTCVPYNYQLLSQNTMKRQRQVLPSLIICILGTTSTVLDMLQT